MAAEIESNGTRSSATVVVAGSTVTGTHASITDVDYFVLTTASAGVLKIDLSDGVLWTGPAQVKVSLERADGTVLAAFRPGMQEFLNVGLSGAGSWYLRVESSAAYGTQLPYQFITSFTPGDPAGQETEPNGSWRQAEVLAAGMAMKGQFFAPTDVDWYRIDVSTPGVLALDISSNSAAGVRLFDPQGAQLMNYAVGSETGRNLSVAAPEAGSYLLRLEDATFWSGAEYTVRYTLAAGDVSAWETEPNNSRLGGSELALGTTKFGQLAHHRDQDYFSVAVASAGTLRIDARAVTVSSHAGATPFNSYPRFTLEDDRGILLGEVARPLDESPLEFTISQAGTYHLRAQASPTVLFYGTYSLTASHVAAAGPVAESESNNQPGVADAWQLDKLAVGDLADLRDVDYFRLDLPAAGFLDLTFAWKTLYGIPSYRLSVEDAAGTTLAAVGHRQYTLIDLQPMAPIPGPGSYFVRLERREGVDFLDDSRYQLAARFTQASVAGYEREGNDERANANALALGGTVRGQLSAFDDVDYFAFTVAAAGVARLNLQRYVNPFAGGYQDYGRYTVLVEDSAGHPLMGAIDLQDSSTWDMALHAPGTYFVRMVTNQGTFLDNRPYDLQVGFTVGGHEAWEREPNDLRAAATTLALGTSIGGQTSSKTDKDYFRVHVDGSGSLQLALQLPVDARVYPNAAYALTVEDATGQLLGGTVVSAPQGTLTVGVAGAGDFFVKLEAAPHLHLVAGLAYGLSAAFTPHPTTGLEVEANDTRETAQPLVLGETLTASLSGGQDVDYFAMPLAGPGLLTLTLGNNLTAQWPYELQVQDESGNVLASISHPGATGSHVVAIQAAGTYYARVGGDTNNSYTSSSAPFTIGASFSPGSILGHEWERNDTPELATPLSPGSSVRGQQAYSDDVDYFVMQPSGTGFLDLDLSFIDGLTRHNFYLYVTDPAGGLVSFNRFTQSGSLRVPVQGTELLYVKLTNTELRQSQFGTTDYLLASRFVPIDIDAVEPEINDTPEHAVALLPGQARSGMLWWYGDVDWYAVDVATPGTLEILLDHPTAEVFRAYSILVEDAAGNLLATFTDIGDGAAHQIGLGAPGSFRIRIAAPGFIDSDAPGETYVLQANVLPGTPVFLETESNDTRAGADPLPLNGLLTGHKASLQDVDHYRLDLAAASTLSITIDADLGVPYGRFLLRLEDAEGQVLVGVRSADREGHLELQAAVDSAGTYYLRFDSESLIIGAYHDPIRYTVQTTTTAGTAGWETEPNNQREAADALGLGETIAGRLNGPDDVDYFRFLAPSTGTYSFVMGANAFRDLHTLSLEDANGDAFATFGQPIAQAPSEISVALTQGQNYYLRVADGIALTNYGTYQVQVLQSTAAPLRYEGESNNTAASADVLVLGEQINGFVAGAEDEDHYRISVTAPGVLRIHFDSRIGEDIESTTHPAYTVRVRDASGALIARKDIATDASLDVALVSAGDIDVVVTARLGYLDQVVFPNTAPYRLSSSWQPDAMGLEVEHNDAIPNRIEDGVSVLGQLHSVADVDRFVLHVEQASTLLVDLTYSARLSDIYLEVHDSAGTLLGVHTRFSSDDEMKLWTLGVGSAGDYVFTIRPEPYRLSFGESPAYSLQVDAVPGQQLFETEGNDTRATADALALGKRIQGTVSSVSDVDHYQVTLATSGILAIDFDAPTNSPHTRHFQITLSDSQGATLLHRITGTDAGMRSGVLAAGSYDIAVAFGDQSFNGGPYSLQASIREPATPPARALLGSEAGELLLGTEGGDTLYGRGGHDRIDGGAGADTLVFESSILNLDIASAAGLTAVRGNFAAGIHAYSVSRIWNVEALQTDDSLVPLPTSASTPLIGTRFDDVLLGTAGDDLLDGWGGNDRINGLAGSDTLALLGLRSTFALMTVGPVTRIQGTDDEYAGTTIKSWNVEHLAFDQSQTVTLAATGGEVIFGNHGDDRWTGTAADEAFDGEGGNDTVDGGAGRDSLLFFDRFDNFTITYPGAGDAAVTVTGKAASSYAGQTVVARNMEVLRFADGTIEVANPPGLVVRSSNSALDEGGAAATLQVSLAAAPTQPVTLTLSPGQQLTADSSQLTFNAQNWATPQAVLIRAVDDTAREAEQTGLLQLAITTSDPLYATVDDVVVSYRISDNGNDNATTGGVRGRLWHDFDKDSVVDTSEVGLQGWTVFDDTNRNGVLDGDEPHTLTDALGHYLLGNLAPGPHTLVAVPETGWLPSALSTGGSRATAITYTAGDGEVALEGPIVGPQGGAGTLANYENLGRATRIAEFHADPRFNSIDGRGSAVVIIDTGIDLDHPSFGPDTNQDGIADRIVYQYDFTGANDPDASDERGHGTHVAGIVGASDPDYAGIAPGVNLIMLKVFSSDRNQGASISDLIEAANWVVEHATEYNIVAVNMSLGAGTYADAYSGYLSTQLQALANLGVVPVAASGNRYYANTRQGVGYPSADPNALSVGAVWAAPGFWPLGGQVGTTDAIAFFSQRDDSESDIFAPGVFITSAEAGGTQIEQTGTSMAAPQISGMVALAQQLARETLGRTLSFDEIRELLASTGAPILDGDNESDIVENTGLLFRRADMLALAEAILALKPQASLNVDVLAGTNAVEQNFGFAATASPAVLDNDDIIVGSYWGDVLRGGGGNDRMQGARGDDRMGGDAGDDDLDGGPDDDLLQGGPGNDTLRGGTGIDMLEGGDGDDIYFVDNPFDEVREVVANPSTGGWDSVFSEVDLQLAPFVEALTLVGPRARHGTGNSQDNVLVGNGLDNTLAGGAGADALTGGPGSDRLDGGLDVDWADYADAPVALAITLQEGGAETIVANDGWGGIDILVQIEGLHGTAWADTLTGNAANNVFQGNGGNDTLIGGAGIDIARYRNAANAMTITLAPDGTDTLTPDGLGGTDTLRSIEGLEGSGFADRLTGNAGSNWLQGHAGNDTLDGSTGADWLVGGSGDDTYQVDTQSDLVFESLDGGTDTILSTVSFYLYAHVEGLVLQGGSANLFGSGNDRDNTLTGNDGSNLLLGWDGNDTIAGNAGNDVLYGVEGADSLLGGAGVDNLIGGNGNDTLDGGSDPDALYGEGNDDLMYGGTGFFTDILTGGAGNDTLDGSASVASGLTRNQGDYDLMNGGAGNDTYYVDTPSDLTFEALNDGTDTVIADISGAGYYLYANVENLTLVGNTPFGVGNELANTLTGSALTNWLLGGAGNDTINGGGGNDVLFGEGGADTFVFRRGTGGDLIGDFTPGTDRIDIAGIGYTSFAQVQARMVQNGGSTAIDLGAGDFVVLVGVAQASMGSADFLLG
jgi:Ca2+-binding RTX toxin-like protein